MAKKLRGSNRIQGGRITTQEVVPIDPRWVRLAIDSCMVQSATAEADSSKITVSMGFGNTTGNILLFSQVPTVDPVTYSSGLQIAADSSSVVVTATHFGLSFRVSSTTFAPADRHHLFVSLDTDHAAGLKVANLYVDGVDVKGATVDANAAFDMKIVGGSLGFPLSDLTKPGGPLHSDTATSVDYSNIQVWLGQYIDPAGISTGKKTWRPGAPGLNDICKELVDWANGEGFDPLLVLTFAGVESIFGTPSQMHTGSYHGVFQFSQAEMDFAIGAGHAIMDTSNQAATWRWFFTNNATTGAQLPWHPVVAARGLDDPTGLYHYLVHNQGPFGMPIILDAINLNGGTGTIGSLDGQLAGTARRMLAQTAWARGMTRSTSIGTWWTALQNYFTGYRTRAAAMLMDTGGVPNIQFFYKDGIIRLPTVAQGQFGLSDILLWGQKADFITDTTAHNDGAGDDFAVVNPDGVTDAA